MPTRIHAGDDSVHLRSPSPDLQSLKMLPPSGTYVVQIPKDQVYRIPPPGNAERYDSLKRRSNARKGCRCLFCLIAALLLVAIVVGVTLLVFYLSLPRFSVDSLLVSNLNISSSSPLSPEFVVGVRAANRNRHFGIYYRQGSSVTINHDGVALGSGNLPAFYQKPKSSTVNRSVLRGSGIKLSKASRTELESSGAVPLKLKLRVPVRVKIGSVKTWEITTRVDCHLTVKGLTREPRIMSEACHRKTTYLW